MPNNGLRRGRLTPPVKAAPRWATIKAIKGAALKVKILLICFMITLTAQWPSKSHAWLIYHKPAFKGKVIDAETKGPIEGAVVAAVYTKVVGGLGPGWSSSPFDARETFTDKDGMFSIPSYTTITQPFSFNSFAEIIIFKPGYGSFPCCQKIPYGINREDTELFFSEDFSKEREVELVVGVDNGPITKYCKVTFGVVELPKLKTNKERLDALHRAGIPGPGISSRKIEYLLKSYNEERSFFGFGPVNWP
jgi:hypothetical protein